MASVYVVTIEEGYPHHWAVAAAFATREEADAYLSGKGFDRDFHLYECDGEDCNEVPPVPENTL